MDQPVSAIVAAFNEAERLSLVLRTLTSSPDIAEVIVVDDGSTDATADIADSFHVRCLRLGSNHGKGHALDQGVRAAQHNILFFCDADITGLTHTMIADIIAPVRAQHAAMCVAVRGRSRPRLTALLAKTAPTLARISGERALTRQLWQQLPAYYKQGYRIEIGLNFFARYHNTGLHYRLCPDIEQVPNERKYGLREGLRRRVRLVLGVMYAYGRLRLEPKPARA